MHRTKIKTMFKLCMNYTLKFNLIHQHNIQNKTKTLPMC